MTALLAGGHWHVEPVWRNAATGRVEFGIARGLWRDGTFAGAAVVVVPAELMSGFWASLDLGPHSSVGLIRDDGWLVARYPVPEGTISLAGYALFTDHLAAAPAGAYVSPVSPADGVSLVVGYTRVPGLPLVAIAGISLDAVLAAYWASVAEAAAVALPMAPRRSCCRGSGCSVCCGARRRTGRSSPAPWSTTRRCCARSTTG